VVVRDTDGYTGGTYMVTVNSARGVTAPAGGIITVTAIALPSASAGAYTLANTEYKADGVTKFGAAGVSVKLIALTWATGRVSATSNWTAEIMGTSYATDANGQWAINLPQEAFTRGATATLEFTYTDADGNKFTRSRSATLAAPATGTVVYWADLAPDDKAAQ